MTLTNAQVLQVLQSLQTLGNNKLPVKLSWKITTAKKTLDGFAKAIEEGIQEIREKYAVKNEDGTFAEAVDENGNNVPNTMQITQENIEKFNQDLNDVLSITVVVLNVELSMADFPDTLEIEPIVLESLSPILIEA